MSYHMDKEVNSALIRLLDALCEWERNSGRRSTLILMPHLMDERMVLAQDGKPLSDDFSSVSKAEWILKLAIQERTE